jgi:hypothetical protein
MNFVDDGELDIELENFEGHAGWDAGMEDSLGRERISILTNHGVAATLHHHRHCGFLVPHCGVGTLRRFEAALCHFGWALPRCTMRGNATIKMSKV